MINQETVDVLLSVRPRWCDLILSGRKTIEVRKTRPKIETPFRCHIYCTQPKSNLLSVMRDGDDCYGTTYHGPPVFIKTQESVPDDVFYRTEKVIAEFICDRIDFFDSAFDEWARQVAGPGDVISSMGWARFNEIIEKQACMKREDLESYFPEEVKAYLWHISDLKVYEKAKQITSFYRPYITDPQKQCEGCQHDLRIYNPDEVESARDVPGSCFQEECALFLKRPPQSWCYVRRK